MPECHYAVGMSPPVWCGSLGAERVQVEVNGMGVQSSPSDEGQGGESCAGGSGMHVGLDDRGCHEVAS